MHDLSKQQKKSRRPTTTHIHNDMNRPIPNKPKNAHYGEVNDIIVITVHGNKPNTISTFFFIFL